MKQNAPLCVRLTSLRERKGWSLGEAAAKTQTVGRFSLVQLENGHTIPSRVRISTVIELVDLYWPKLDVNHFYSGIPKKSYHVTRRTR